MHPLLAGAAQLERGIRPPVKALERLGERRRVRGRHQAAGEPILDHVGDAAHRARDHRPGPRQGFEQDERQPLPQRRQDHGVGGEQERPNLLEPAQELDPGLEPELPGAALERSAQRTIARQRALEVVAAAAELGERLEQHRVALLLLEPRRAHPQRLEQGGAEVVAPAARFGALGLEVGQVRAVGQHVQPRARDAVVVGQRIGDRAAHRGHGVGALELAALEPPLRARVRAPDDVLGDDQVRHPRGIGEGGEVAVGGRPDVMDVKQPRRRAAQLAPAVDHAAPVPA